MEGKTAACLKTLWARNWCRWHKQLTTNTCIPFLFMYYGRDGPWPDPTRTYFWPSVNKRPTRLWPGYFLAQHEEIFLSQKGKIEKFDIFRGNFPNSSPSHKWLTQRELQNFDRDASLLWLLCWMAGSKQLLVLNWLCHSHKWCPDKVKELFWC